MKLILFRHGLAVEREAFFLKNPDDSQRPLVPKGRARTRMMGQILQKRLAKVDMVVTSPYLRSLETAKILGQILKPTSFHESVELIPSGPPQAFAAWLKSKAGAATTIVAVGHEPQLSLFATWSLSGYLESFIELKKSGAICLAVENFEEYGPKSAELKWHLQPQFFEG
ncbi:MAG: phosphohistidine phosphatase SixA [Oligoflexia bacterium]|nr:MAG: phosphohistidine phosphatase SixA [Oligoflexia bacterium]